MNNPCCVINAKGEIVKNVFLSELTAWEANGYKYYDPNAPMPTFETELTLEVEAPKPPKRTTRKAVTTDGDTN